MVARDAERLKTIAADLRIRGALCTHEYCMDLNELENHSKMLDAAEKAMDGVDYVLISHGTLSQQQACEENVSRKR